MMMMLTRMTRMIMMSTGPSATAGVAGGVAVGARGGKLGPQRGERRVVAAIYLF